MTLVAVEVKASKGEVALSILDYVSAFHTVSVPVGAPMKVPEALSLADLLMGRSSSPVEGAGWSAERSDGGVVLSVRGSGYPLHGMLAVSVGITLSGAALTATSMEGEH